MTDHTETNLNGANTALAGKAPPPLPPRPPEVKRTYPCLSFKKLMGVIKDNCPCCCVRESHGKGVNKIVFLPAATRDLDAILTYGRHSPVNHYEQKYIGLGHIFLNEGSNAVTLVVSHFVEILTTNRTPVSASNFTADGKPSPGLDFLEYNVDMYKKYEGQLNHDQYGGLVDPFLNIAGGSEYVLEGHSHPNLGVFLSGPDKVSGGARAAKAPIATFVCDPIRKQMLGCIGKDFEDAEVIVLDQRETAEQKTESIPVEHIEQCDIIHAAQRALRENGNKGSIRVKKHFSGGIELKIRMILPRVKR